MLSERLREKLTRDGHGHPRKKSNPEDTKERDGEEKLALYTSSNPDPTAVLSAEVG